MGKELADARAALEGLTCMTQLYATSLAAMFVRTMCAMLYLARRTWPALLLSSTALPLLRKRQFGMSIDLSLPQ